MILINIEGIDAVGKETVSKMLEKALIAKGHSVKRISFPIYEGDAGKLIKDVLMGACGDAPNLHPDLISPVYTLDRLAYFRANIDKLFNSYEYIICDRSYFSNFMYQASKLYNETSTEEVNGFRSDIAALGDWMIKNYKWEIKDTGLSYCSQIYTVVLQMSEDDRVKQMANRKTADTNETNTKYLENCRKFVNEILTNKRLCHILRDYITPKIGNRDRVCECYFDNVKVIEVAHGNTQKEINVSVNNTVNRIIDEVLFPNANKKNDTFDEFCETHKEFHELIGVIIKNMYNCVNFGRDNLGNIRLSVFTSSRDNSKHLSMVIECTRGYCLHNQAMIERLFDTAEMMIPRSYDRNVEFVYDGNSLSVSEKEYRGGSRL